MPDFATNNELGPIDVMSIEKINLTVGPNSIAISPDGVTITVGPNSLKIAADGITVNGIMLTLAGTASTKISTASLMISQ